jgi:hypothetical protein
MDLKKIPSAIMFMAQYLGFPKSIIGIKGFTIHSLFVYPSVAKNKNRTETLSFPINPSILFTKKKRASLQPVMDIIFRSTKVVVDNGLPFPI